MTVHDVGPGVVKSISILGGVVLVVVCISAGVDGEIKLLAASMIAFGLGIPIGEILSRRTEAKT